MVIIRKWHAKAIVQKGISYLPGRERINYWFQKNVTKGALLTDEYFGYKITHARDHLTFFQEHQDRAASECAVLELGTGWYPIVPMALFLSGFRQINSLDLSDWMTEENLRLTARKFLEWRSRGDLEKYLPKVDEERWADLVAIADDKDTSLDNLCGTIRLNRLIGDARHTGFPDGSLDFICSNNTFEHIPEGVLRDILAEFTRITRKGGLMSHFIDMTDHFAHLDASITIYNFLRYSDRQWNLIDNCIQPQNRLRFKDFKDIYGELGIQVTHGETDAGDLKALDSVPLAEKFSGYTRDQLAISHAYLVSRM